MAIVPLTSEHQVWQLRAQWEGPGFASGESSWSFVTLVDPSDNGAELYGLWQTHLEPVWCRARPANWGLVRILVEDRWPHLKAPLVVDYSSSLQPDSSGAPAHPSISPIITWRTEHPGRSFRGRTYWGHMRAADIDNGWHLGGDAEAWVYEFGRVMIEEFGVFADPDRPGFAIVSRQHNGAVLDPPVFTRPLEFADRQYLTLQRRRNHAPAFFG